MTTTHRIGPLFTDLYELTMAASYFDNRIFSDATFSVFVRDTSQRNYLVAAGLEDVLRELEGFQFSKEELDYLRRTGLFSEAFITYLKDLRFTGTSNVLAGKQFVLLISGTMAHSYILAFGREIEAFSAFAETFPESSVFLIDTYNTLEGACNAAKVALDMQAKGCALLGVRLDSGDMVALSQGVRRILDEAGLPGVKIYAISGFDEFEILDVIAQGAKIDAFGVGTKVGVSADAPYLDIVYKLVRFNQRNIRKLSTDKVTLAGEKQVYRRIDENGMLKEDIIGLRDDVVDNGEPLLVRVMEKGRCTHPHPVLQEIQDRFKTNFSRLPEEYKSVLNKRYFLVKLSARLKDVQKNMGRKR